MLCNLLQTQRQLLNGRPQESARLHRHHNHRPRIVIMLMLICRSCRLWAVSAGSEAGKQGRPTWPRRDERRLILRTSTPKPAKVVVLRRRFEGESARLSRVLGRGDPTTRQPTARHRPEHGHLPAVFCCRAIHLKPE